MADEVTGGAVEPAWLEALRRNSGLALDREGDWRFGTGRVENPRVQELFHAGVEVRPGGEVALRVGGMWCYVKCDGPARFVRSLDLERGEVTLRGGRTVSLVGAVAGWGPDERLVLWLEGIGGPVACPRVVHQRFVERLEERGEGLVIALPGAGGEVDRLVQVVALAEIPRADAARPTKEEGAAGTA